MLDDKDFEDIKESLSNPDASHRISMLRVLLKKPTGDPRVIEVLEGLLDDHTVGVLSIPYLFGEIRLQAAQVLQKELNQLNRFKSQIIESYMPLNSQNIVDMEVSLGLNIRDGGIEGLSRRYTNLRELGAIPKITVEI